MPLKRLSPAGTNGRARQGSKQPPANTASLIAKQAIPTAAGLRRMHRRLDRRQFRAAAVLAAMRDGRSLHRMYTRHGPAWALSNGTPVNDNVARLVIANPDVVGVGDGLFANSSQTFRYAE